MHRAHAVCVLAATVSAAASSSHAQLARFVPADCNLTGTLFGEAFDPVSMELLTVNGTSTVNFGTTSGGGGTSGGLVGVMAGQVDMLAEIIDGRGVEAARIVVSSDATASYNPAYLGSISGAFQLTLVFELTNATPFEIVQLGDPGSVSLSALTGQIVGDTLLPGAYEISHFDGAFANPANPTFASSGTWTLYLPAPSAAAPLAMMALLAGRRRR